MRLSAGIHGVRCREDIVLAGGGGVEVEGGAVAVQTGNRRGASSQFIVHWEEMLNPKVLKEDFGSCEIVGADSGIDWEETDVESSILR